MRKAPLVILNVTVVDILVSCSNSACVAAALVPIPDPPVRLPPPKPSTPHVEPPPKSPEARGAGGSWKETAADRGKDAVGIAQRVKHRAEG